MGKENSGWFSSKIIFAETYTKTVPILIKKLCRKNKINCDWSLFLLNKIAIVDFYCERCNLGILLEKLLKYPNDL